MICALELERQERAKAGDPYLLGEWPFEIGMWVGKAASADERKKGMEYGQAYAQEGGRPKGVKLDGCGAQLALGALHRCGERCERHVACTKPIRS